LAVGLNIIPLALMPEEQKVQRLWQAPAELFPAPISANQRADTVERKIPAPGMVNLASTLDGAVSGKRV
jgi:hypothetical protein